jgi:hypothetical protein
MDSGAGRTSKVVNLIVGALLFIVMPSIECVGSVVGAEWGEAQVLRVFAFGRDPGLINPYVRFPLFPNSDLFSNAFALLGALLL